MLRFMVIALALMIASCGAVSQKELLHTSIAEQAAYDAGMARPEKECAHGWTKTYYFVKTETGNIRNPYTKWDCIDKASSDKLLAQNKEVGQKATGS